MPDDTDRVIHQWARVRPDLDVSSIGVIARLARLHAIIDEEMEAFFAEHVVTKPTFSLLVALVRIDQPGGVSQRRLANEMRLTPGTVSARVDRMVRDGLVARAPDPSDKRGSLVSLTERGREVFEVVVPAYLANEARLLGSLTADEQATLAGVLRKLLVAFEGSAQLEGGPRPPRADPRPGARGDCDATRRRPTRTARPVGPLRGGGITGGCGGVDRG